MAEEENNKENKEEKIELKTIPPDPRFQNTNQTYHCFTAFIDYHRCTQLLGKEYEPCNYFKKVYVTICPNSWISHWETQLEEGVFPVRLPKPTTPPSKEENGK